MFKGIAALIALLVGGGYLMGAFGGAGYSHDVSRPQTEVMAALEDLDITAQPGAPGSTAEAAGGVKPLFRLEKTADHMTWYVMSGDKVATAMTASFTPIDGGKGTRVRASVKRGDAPDDVVSPAFRSNGLTLGLFGMALEGEINKLTAPPPGNPEDCQKLRDQITESNLAANPPGESPSGLIQAIGNGAKTTMRLGAMEQQLRQAGCLNEGNGGGFSPVESHMAPADPSETSAPHERGGVHFEPGKPMVDPNAAH